MGEQRKVLRDTKFSVSTGNPLIPTIDGAGTLDGIPDILSIDRGYFGIGVYHPKTEENIGTLWRSAYIFGASFIFTIGRRYKKQPTDTVKAFRHIPLWNFVDFDDFIRHIPYNVSIVCVEITNNAKLLSETSHPEQAVYLLGAEDYGIPEEIMRGHQKVIIPSVRGICLNVAVAGSIVMYDRLIKGYFKERRNGSARLST